MIQPEAVVKRVHLVIGFAVIAGAISDNTNSAGNSSNVVDVSSSNDEDIVTSDSEEIATSDEEGGIYTSLVGSNGTSALKDNDASDVNIDGKRVSNWRGLDVDKGCKASWVSPMLLKSLKFEKIVSAHGNDGLANVLVGLKSWVIPQKMFFEETEKCVVENITAFRTARRSTRIKCMDSDYRCRGCWEIREEWRPRR